MEKYSDQHLIQIFIYLTKDELFNVRNSSKQFHEIIQNNMFFWFTMIIDHFQADEQFQLNKNYRSLYSQLYEKPIIQKNFSGAWSNNPQYYDQSHSDINALDGNCLKLKTVCWMEIFGTIQKIQQKSYSYLPVFRIKIEDNCRGLHVLKFYYQVFSKKNNLEDIIYESKVELPYFDVQIKKGLGWFHYTPANIIDLSNYGTNLDQIGIKFNFFGQYPNWAQGILMDYVGLYIVNKNSIQKQLEHLNQEKRQETLSKLADELAEKLLKISKN